MRRQHTMVPQAGGMYTISIKLGVEPVYYTSGEWREDYEADERGELPPDLKRGVLSQDALYDLLEGARL